eukprot:2342066-Rhodomonas_salina.1
MVRKCLKRVLNKAPTRLNWKRSTFVGKIALVCESPRIVQNSSLPGYLRPSREHYPLIKVGIPTPGTRVPGYPGTGYTRGAVGVPARSATCGREGKAQTGPGTELMVRGCALGRAPRGPRNLEHSVPPVGIPTRGTRVPGTR